jgi:hypothetical protein
MASTTIFARITGCLLLILLLTSTAFAESIKFKAPKLFGVETKTDEICTYPNPSSWAISKL